MEEPVTGPSEPRAASESAPPEDVAQARATEEERSRVSLARRALVVSLIVGVLALLGWATLAADRGSSLVAQIAAGTKPQAPGWQLGVIWPRSETWPRSAVTALGDGKLALAELRGHPVVVNFWASWCIPCRDEAPILRASAIRHRGQVVFVGIDIQDFTSEALKFLREFKVNYVSVRDKTDASYRAYGLTGVPETYYIDASGRIVAHAPGAVSRRTLEEGVAAMSGSAPTSRTLRSGAHVKR